MTVLPYASEAKISEALTAIGAELIGQTEQQLLQQIVVAAATTSTNGIVVTSDGYVRVGNISDGLAFFGAGGRTQPLGDNNQSITNAGSGPESIHADTEFDGGAGGNSYTVGGIVKVLKELGLLG
jgi:hypothetical protein